MADQPAHPPALEHAKLIPLSPRNEGNAPQTADAIPVQFNPASLQLNLSNTLAESRNAGSASAAQYVSRSESSLQLQLVFDGTAPTPGTRIPDQSSAPPLRDVRELTRPIVERFLKPRGEGKRPRAPLRCRFQWGAFSFDGLVASYRETLDFFSPEGIPLRATLNLTLKEDRFQYELLHKAFARRAQPWWAPPGEDINPAQAAANGRGDPREWRDVARFNGVENPRFGTPGGLAVPGEGGPDGRARQLGLHLGGGKPSTFGK